MVSRTVDSSNRSKPDRIEAREDVDRSLERDV